MSLKKHVNWNVVAVIMCFGIRRHEIDGKHKQEGSLNKSSYKMLKVSFPRSGHKSITAGGCLEKCLRMFWNFLIGKLK